MPGTILVPLDGSPLSEEALPLAAHFATRLELNLLLVRVMDRALMEKEVYDSELENEIRQYLAGLKGQVSTVFQLNPDRIQSVVVSGEPAEEIAAIASVDDAELIVMSSHGRSGFSRLLMGSVAAEVVRKTPVPVIVRHSRPHEEREDSVRSGPIVVALDGTPESELALEPAFKMAQPGDTGLLLLRVLRPFVPVAELEEWYIQHQDKGEDYLNAHAFEHYRTKAENYLESLAEKLRARQVKCKTAVVVGEPSDEIVKFAEHNRAMLLILAARTHGELYQFLLGSAADEVLIHTETPVMLVPMPHHSNEPKPELTLGASS